MRQNHWLRRWWKSAVEGTPEHAGAMKPSRRKPQLLLEDLEQRWQPTVFNVNSVATLQAAISNSVANDTIVLAPTTYKLIAGPITIDHSLNLQTKAGGGQAILDGNSAHRVINIVGSATNVKLTNLVVQNGLAYGGVNPETSHPIGVNVGGGIYNEGNLTLLNSTVRNNKALGSNSSSNLSAYGGGIFSYGGTLTFTNSFVINNTARSAAIGDGYGGFLEGDAYGGGVYAYGGASVTFVASTVTGNLADGADVRQTSATSFSAGGAYGGGFFGFDIGQFTVKSGSTFANNTAQGGDATYASYGGRSINLHGGYAEGGAIDVVASTVSILQSNVTGNKSIGGAALVAKVGPANGAAPIGQADGGYAIGGGVAAWSYNINPTIVNSAFPDSAGADLTITGSKIDGNLVQGGAATANLASVSNAYAGGAEGGGLDAEGFDSVKIAASSLSNNNAQGGTATAYNASSGGYATGGGRRWAGSSRFP